MPSWADLSFSAPSSDTMRLWSFAYDPGTGQFTGISAGNRLGKWVGENFRGRRLVDLHLPANYEEARRFLTRVVTAPLVARTSGRLFAVDSFVVIGERIMLPLAGDGQTGDGILGASDYAPPPLLGAAKMIYENVEWYTT
jgi:hypothetical protein